MLKYGNSQSDSDVVRARRSRFSFFIWSVLGCLCTLVGFVFLNWSAPFSYYYPYSSSPFLNGPDVFQTIAYTYGYGVLAGIWIWVIPAAVLVALVLGYVGWLRDARLLALVSIPAAVGLVLLSSFIFTGEPWDYYLSSGYGITVLGLLTVLISGLGARWSLSLGIQNDDVKLPALIWCALAGGVLVFLSFFLPWLLLRVPLSTFPFYSPGQHFTYQAVQATGPSLASNSFPFLPPTYPRMAPEGYWLLWLIPLCGLLSAGSAWASLRGLRVTRWFWMLISLVPIPLFLLFLKPMVQSSFFIYQDQDQRGDPSLYGWHLALLGLTLIFLCGVLWKEVTQKVRPSQEQQRKIVVRRSLLGGMIGLAAVACGGYLYWRTNKMYNAIQTLSAFANPYKTYRPYRAVAWAADGKRLAAIGSFTLQIWNIPTMKQVLHVDYPSFVAPPRGESASLAWSPDQRFIAAASAGATGVNLVYEVASAKLVSRWSTDPLQQGNSWSGDSQRVATIQELNGVEIHDAVTGKLLQSFTLPPVQYSTGIPKVMTVSWSPDNRWLAVGGQDTELNHVFFIVWDVSSGAQVLSTSYAFSENSEIGEVFDVGIDEQFVGVAWSPDGKRLAVASDSTGVRLWDVPGKKLLQTYIGAGGRVTAFAWSPDSRYIAVGEDAEKFSDTVVCIWDTTSNRTLFTYRGHEGSVNGLSWSSQGNMIASLDVGGDMRIWQPEIA